MTRYHWGKPVNADVWHVFEGSESLCGKFMYGGANEPLYQDHTYTPSENCHECCKEAGLL